ncbi:hypothetical protein [Streptomyces avermitilis]|uniref:hypothetical protein n=1 Tax=Streptomyces avermitilis TaxID=33903 RepID=UPI0033AE32E4
MDAVHRQDVGPVGVETAVGMVFQGPNDLERRKGITTELPLLKADFAVRTDGGRVSIELPSGTGPLTGTALAQLSCTVAGARLTEAPDTDTASTRVTVTVPGAWHSEGSSETCPSATGAG